MGGIKEAEPLLRNHGDTILLDILHPSRLRDNASVDNYISDTSVLHLQQVRLVSTS